MPTDPKEEMCEVCGLLSAPRDPPTKEELCPRYFVSTGLHEVTKIAAFAACYRIGYERLLKERQAAGPSESSALPSVDLEALLREARDCVRAGRDLDAGLHPGWCGWAGHQIQRIDAAIAARRSAPAGQLQEAGAPRDFTNLAEGIVASIPALNQESQVSRIARMLGEAYADGWNTCLAEHPAPPSAPQEGLFKEGARAMREMAAKHFEDWHARRHEVVVHNEQGKPHTETLSGIILSGPPIAAAIRALPLSRRASVSGPRSVRDARGRGEIAMTHPTKPAAGAPEAALSSPVEDDAAAARMLLYTLDHCANDLHDYCEGGAIWHIEVAFERIRAEAAAAEREACARLARTYVGWHHWEAAEKIAAAIRSRGEGDANEKG